MEENMEKIKNTILLMITRIAVLVLIISVCCVDSTSIVPLITFGVSLGWLVLFVIANDDNMEVIEKQSWLLK